MKENQMRTVVPNDQRASRQPDDKKIKQCPNNL